MTTLLVSSSNLSPVCWWKHTSCGWVFFMPWQPSIWFPVSRFLIQDNYLGGSIGKQITLGSSDNLQQPVVCTETATAGPWIDPLRTFPEPTSISPVILFEGFLFLKTTWQRSTATSAKLFVDVGPRELEGTTDGAVEASSVFFPTTHVTSFRAQTISKKKCIYFNVNRSFISVFRRFHLWLVPWARSFQSTASRYIPFPINTQPSMLLFGVVFFCFAGRIHQNPWVGRASSKSRGLFIFCCK